MLTLGQIRDWLTAQLPELHGCIAVGTIDGNKEKFVGVYPLKVSGSSQRICLGGAEQTRYQERGASILVHWTKSAATAESRAMDIYNLFYGRSRVTMGDTLVVKLDPGPAPVPVGKDAQGICEYVIQLKIIYERVK